MKFLAAIFSLIFVMATSTAVAGVAPNSGASALQRSGAKIKAPEKNHGEHETHSDEKSQ
jgi:hypothetical protein